MAFRSKYGHARKPRMGAKAYPLRKILGTRMVPLKLADGRDSEYSILHEVLECGHTMRPREDFVGETNASKRRCTQCFRESKTGAAVPDKEK
jgi:hypothetical protein